MKYATTKFETHVEKDIQEYYIDATGSFYDKDKICQAEFGMDYCCTAVFISDFYNLPGYRYHSKEDSEQIFDLSVTVLEKIEEEAREEGYKMMVAITIPDQKLFCKALRTAGFLADEPLSGGNNARGQHRPLILWSKEVV